MLPVDHSYTQRDMFDNTNLSAAEYNILTDSNDFWDADPNCYHETYSAYGDGVKCKHCSGWFCY